MSMNKVMVATAAAAMLLSSSVVLAAPNPAGTGQPSQSCGSDTATMSPQGFSTDGFAKAELHYAGSDGTPSQLHAQSSAAVSQYDVACYQVTQNQP